MLITLVAAWLALAPVPPPDAPPASSSGAPSTTTPRVRAAALAAGITLLAAPALWFFGSAVLCSAGACCVAVPLAGAGGAIGTLVGGEFHLGAVGVSAALGLMGTFAVALAGASIFQFGATSPLYGALDASSVALWTAVVASISGLTALGVGAAVYAALPDEPARAQTAAPARIASRVQLVAMAY